MADAPLFIQPNHDELTPDSQPETDLPLLVAPLEGIPPIIDSPSALDRVATKLSSSRVPVALDTERAQGRTYGASAYLVQIRKQDVGTFLIDSHALPDLRVLNEALNYEWILHAADQDLVCMAELGLKPPRMFDTEIAARLLGSEKFGLGAITEEYLGIRLKKNHQNEDWSRRPLPESWLAYAALDVELLPQLRDVLRSKLEETGRLDWAEQEFDFELNSPVQPRENHWRNLKGIGRLKRPADLAIAKELWNQRESLAHHTDTAPGRVLTPNAIIEASAQHPSSKKEMLTIGDFKRPIARKNADQWWSALEKAYSLEPSDYPERPSHDPFAVPAASQWKRIDPLAFERLVEVREMVAEISGSLRISPDMVLSAKCQRALAWWPVNRSVPTPEHPEPHPISVKANSAFIGVVIERLSECGSRPWQLALIRSYLEGHDNPLPILRSAQQAPNHKHQH